MIPRRRGVERLTAIAGVLGGRLYSAAFATPAMT